MPDFLSHTPEGQEINSAIADAAYNARRCHDAITDRGDYADITPCKNSKPLKSVTAGALARGEVPRASNYFGRAIWRRSKGTHRRIPAGTKMHCMKLMCQRLMSRDFDLQFAERQVRIAILNGYCALGVPITGVAG